MISLTRSVLEHIHGVVLCWGFVEGRTPCRCGWNSRDGPKASDAHRMRCAHPRSTGIAFVDSITVSGTLGFTAKNCWFVFLFRKSQAFYDPTRWLCDMARWMRNPIWICAEALLPRNLTACILSLVKCNPRQNGCHYCVSLVALKLARILTPWPRVPNPSFLAPWAHTFPGIPVWRSNTSQLYHGPFGEGIFLHWRSLTKQQFKDAWKSNSSCLPLSCLQCMSLSVFWHVFHAF